MAGLSRTAQDAIAWAKSGDGQSYPGLCDHFVGLAYGQAHSGYETAMDHWQASSSKHTDDHPDVGALVYFATGHAAGHVAIVSGYDAQGRPLIVTTHTNGGKPTEMRLDQSGLDYLGWATPEFQGKTAATIPPKDVAPSITPAASGANDMSGIDFKSKGKGGKGTPVAATAGPNVPDTLSPEDAAKVAGINWNLIQANPDLLKVFQDASKNGWFTNGEVGKALFTSALQNTPWFKNNSEWAQKALQQQAVGGKAWEDQVATAKRAVQTAAASAGADLDPATLDGLTQSYLMNGWYDPARSQFLNDALASHLNSGKGTAGAVVDQLKQLAAANGVTYSDQYYEDAARNIVSKTGTIEDYTTDIRKHAASAYPVFADKIMNQGMNVKDIASPYMQTMADVLELPVDQISLNDPNIQQALGGVDKDGTPAAKGLWAFQQQLRKDPRWQTTDNAYKAYSDAAESVLSMFGFR